MLHCIALYNGKYLALLGAGWSKSRVQVGLLVRSLRGRWLTDYDNNDASRRLRSDEANQ